MSQSAPASEVILVSTHRVGCDGGNGALGHPLVYLDLGSNGEVECPYCDRLFRHEDHAHSYADPSARQEGEH